MAEKERAALTRAALARMTGNPRKRMPYLVR